MTISLEMIQYSIIVAVFNRIDEVKELLASAEQLEFDRHAFEFIFVDDGSGDNSFEVLSNLADTESRISLSFTWDEKIS